MTNKQIKKYFEQRPNANELYLVGNMVFTGPEVAAKVAEQAGLAVEIKRRNDPDEPESDEATGAEAEPAETIKEEAPAPEPAPKPKKKQKK